MGGGSREREERERMNVPWGSVHYLVGTGSLFSVQSIRRVFMAGRGAAARREGGKDEKRSVIWEQFSI